MHKARDRVRDGQILDKFIQGDTCKELASMFNMSTANIMRLVHREARDRGLKEIKRKRTKGPATIEVKLYGKNALRHYVRLDRSY